jgi:hypothetical protein
VVRYSVADAEVPWPAVLARASPMTPVRGKRHL